MTNPPTTLHFELAGEKKGTPIEISATVTNQFDGDGQWLRGNCHCHLQRWLEEDSAVDPCALFRKQGCDFCVAMDHDRILDLAPAGSDLIVVPGAELSPMDIVGLGISEVPQSDRSRPRLEQSRAIIESVVSQGGVAVVAHPPGRWNAAELV